jgi:hypothetical protein
MIWNAFNLAVKGDGFGGISADYAVVRDYADQNDLDRIGVWSVVKSMANAYSLAAAKKRGKK